MTLPGDPSLLDPEDTDSDAARQPMPSFHGEVSTDSSLAVLVRPVPEEKIFEGELTTDEARAARARADAEEPPASFEGEVSTDSALAARVSGAEEASPFGIDPSTASGRSGVPFGAGSLESDSTIASDRAPAFTDEGTPEEPPPFSDDGGTLAVDGPTSFRDDGSTLAVDGPRPFGPEDSNSTPSVDHNGARGIEVVLGQPASPPSPVRSGSLDPGRSSVLVTVAPSASPAPIMAALLALAMIGLVAAVVWRPSARAPAPPIAQPVLAPAAPSAAPEAWPKSSDRSLSGPLLSVKSQPTGARVTVRGQVLGSTPLLLRQPEGTTRVPIELGLRGHKRFRADLAPDTDGHFGANVSLEPGVDLEAWLEKPGTRLLVVDFFASWCAPCVAELPHWKALADKHRKDGLRVIVVVTQDPGDHCEDPGWNPDDLVCDPDGAIARRFGASDALPVAHLWSWQGRLLARRARLATIEKEIKAYVERSPRVALDVADSAGLGDAVAFTDLLSDAMLRADKMMLVPTPRQRAQLDALRRESFKSRYDEKKQCELGKEIPPNTLLRANLARIGGSDMLSLQLFSTETSCLVGSSLSPFAAADPSGSVDEGVTELFTRLRSRVDLP